MMEYRPITEFSYKKVPLQIILQNHKKWIKEREGEKADLIGADLTGADLSEVYLRGANLIGINLEEANLSEANLSETNLFGANLKGADLVGADLSKANLTNAKMGDARMKGAYLNGTNLEKARLIAADLSDTNLLRANLKRAKMGNIDLSGANLTKADLSKADLTRANLRGANLEDAILVEADLIEANLSSADLIYAELRDADLSKAKLEKAKLNSVNLSNSILVACSLIKADLTGANLSGACLDKADFSEWIITGVRCTHIIFGDEREILRFNPGEFERKYSYTRRLSEIILDISFTGSTYYIGNLITRSINYLMRSHVVELKGIEAVSNNESKLLFNILDDNFYKKKKKEVEINLKDALNKYFRDNSIGKELSLFGEIFGDASDGIINSKDNIPVHDTWQIDLDVTQDKLAEHYTKLGKIGESIYNIVSSIFDTKL